MKRPLVFEALALIAVIFAVGHLSLPLFDNVFLKRRPNEIVVRIYVKEYLGFEPDTIVVKNGERVRLVLIGMDVGHSFVIPEFGVNSGLVLPGEKKIVEFTPTKAGDFEFYCGTICSPMHPFMRGTLKVT